MRKPLQGAGVESNLLRKITCAAVLPIVLGAIQVHAQERMVTAKDSIAVSINIYDRLFAGIALSGDRHARALKYIREVYVKQVTVKGPASNQWASLKTWTDRRDSLLKSLITSVPDKLKFDRHAASERANWPR
jgi:hypothetical protein